MSFSQNAKLVLLGVLIALGTIASKSHADAAQSEVLVVAGGCFWCVEADFERVPGVHEVVTGYTGGRVANPSYRQVTSGQTGHYEAARISFDPSFVSRGQILSLFFRSIDPTDAGGQFCDRGDSYRTAIFFTTDAQRSAAKRAKEQAAAALGREVVTPILPAQTFYDAEAYHQDYHRSRDLVITRFGPKRKSEAYKAYRSACGRDQRVRELWGADAPFVQG